MSVITITGFKGMVPNCNPATLQNNYAVLAQNCILWHNDLRSLQAPLAVITPAAISGTVLSIYKIGMTLPNTQYWMQWNTDVDVCRGLIANDVSERTYFTGAGGVPQVTNLSMATSGGSSYPVASYQLGIPQPTVAMTLVPSDTTTAPQELRAYVYTYVSAWGEEGAPSPFAITTVFSSGSVALSGIAVAPGGNYNIASKNIYRSQNTSGGSAIYQYVATIPNATTTYNDTILDKNLGGQLATIGFIPPPASLVGLKVMPNGMLVGFSGYSVYFCEPYLPYAWPIAYQQTVDFPIVGLGVYGTSVVVCTMGSPYIISGVNPGSMSMQKLEVESSCVSKRSIVSIGSGVMYASPDGLIYVGAGGARNVTINLYSRIDWQALGPQNITAFYHDGKYIAAFSTGGGFILNSTEDTSLTTFTGTVTAGRTDPTSDALYLSIAGQICQFNAGANNTYTWSSKLFQLDATPSPRCARVDADSYPVTFNLLADGVSVYSYAVPSQDIFPLPSGYRCRQLQVQLIGNSPVRVVEIADSPVELRNV